MSAVQQDPDAMGQGGGIALAAGESGGAAAVVAWLNDDRALVSRAYHLSIGWTATEFIPMLTVQEAADGQRVSRDPGRPAMASPVPGCGLPSFGSCPTDL